MGEILSDPIDDLFSLDPSWDLASHIFKV